MAWPGTMKVVIIAAAITGYAIAALTVIPRGVMGEGGVGGGDAHAYWTAGRQVMTGGALYGGAPGAVDAYQYPPPFAQLIAPVAAVMPAFSFVWLWRALGLACLVFAAGGWRAAGIALLVFPPAIVELDTANVHFLLAAACALVLRGRAWALPFAFLLKLAGTAAVPFALRRNWRGLVSGAIVAGGLVVASYLAAPGYWADFSRLLLTAQPTEYWTNLGHAVPVVARLLVAAVVGLAALRWPVLLPIAFVLSMPVLWLNSLAVLVCLAPAIGAGAGRAMVRLWPPLGTSGLATPQDLPRGA